MTDGKDNMSEKFVNSLEKLVENIGAITGPRDRKPLYQPVTTRREATEVIASQRRGVTTKVPVFLFWVLLGEGGRQFMESDVPRGIVYVDVSNVAGGSDLRVPSGAMAPTAPSSARRAETSQIDMAKAPVYCGKLVQANDSDEDEDCGDDGQSSFAVDVAEEKLLLCAIGTRLLVAPNDSGSAGSLPSLKGGKAAAAEAIVIETDENEDSGTTVTVLYADERTESHVVPQRLHPVPMGCLIADPSSASSSALTTGEALQLVHLATTNPEGLLSIAMQPDDGKSTPKTVGAATKGVTIDVARHPNRAKLFAPPAAVISAIDPSVLAASQRCVEQSIRDLTFAAPSKGFLLDLMAKVGGAAVKARFDDEERGLAQILAHAALKSLTQGRSVTTDERLYQTTIDRIQSLRAAGSGAALQWRPSRGCLEGDQDELRKWQRLLVSVAEAAMGLLAEDQVLTRRTDYDGDGGGGGDDGSATSVFTASDPEFPALHAALRFLDPVVNPFCLSRCIARKHRGQLMPSFNQPRPRTSLLSSSPASEDGGSASLVSLSTPRSSLVVAGSTAAEAASTPGTPRLPPL